MLSPSRTGAWLSILAEKMTTVNMQTHRSSRRNPRCELHTHSVSQPGITLPTVQRSLLSET